MGADLLSALAEKAQRGDGEVAGRGGPWDVGLLVTVCLLVGLGLVMLYSASAVMAAERMGHHFVLVKSQLQKLFLGLILLVVGLKLDYRWYKRLIYPILGGSVALLALVAIPGIGTVQNGARRWFSVFGMSFQPAEVAKLAAVMFLAYSVSKKGGKMGSFAVGFIPHLLIIGLMVGLLMLQPDFGSSVILLSMMMIMLFVSGARIAYLMGFGLLGVVGAASAILGREYRMKRVLAFLDPWSYRSDIGYQISESLIAIGSGGVGGKGLGQGTGKLGYVPELWNDFIGTIVAEELGLVGVVALVALFLSLIWRGMRIALCSVDPFGKYLAFGLTAMFGLQATANLGVVTGLLPTKGLTLPFVSFGGTSLIIGMFATGILLNISRNAPDMWELGREAREARSRDARWKRKRAGILKRRDDLRDRFEEDDED
jgi:cell division protein FtsW